MYTWGQRPLDQNPCHKALPDPVAFPFSYQPVTLVGDTFKPHPRLLHPCPDHSDPPALGSLLGQIRIQGNLMCPHCGQCPSKFLGPWRWDLKVFFSGFMVVSELPFCILGGGQEVAGWVRRERRHVGGGREYGASSGIAVGSGDPSPRGGEEQSPEPGLSGGGTACALE